ncbi:MAG: protein adenylyltransferase SelO [Halieaceae bacterium]
MTAQPNIPFDNSYARLPDQFFSRLAPTPVSRPGPIRVNTQLAELLGIDPEWLASEEGTAVIAGNRVPTGADPIATVYAGHQFGSYNPQLGDGRAILLGEVVGSDGKRYDLQLKGSGPTPYSRGGDGRAPLGPVIREYVVSEAMYALGVPTTRALAAATTGDTVTRQQFEPGAVLARVAASHIRIGTFQFFAAKGDTEALHLLVDHVLERHYPEMLTADNRPLALLQAAISSQAALIARWQLLGFIHGVMNTDNMLLSGETVDYGPCAFLDAFNPETVFSSIDQGGRYAYRNQPGMAHWNLTCLAQTLLPLIDSDTDSAVAQAQEAIDSFPVLFMDAHTDGLAAKLGLENVTEADTALIEDLFKLMAENKADFTLTFRRLTDLANPESGRATVAELYPLPEALLPWCERWQQRLAEGDEGAAERRAGMYQANPIYIPRNHLVEEAIRAAVDEGDLTPFNTLVDRLAQPFDYEPDDSRYALPPGAGEEVRETFCGT